MTLRRILFAIVLLSFGIPILMLIYLSLSAQWVFPAVFSHPFTGDWWSLLFDTQSALLSSSLLSLTLSTSVSAAATAGGFFASRAVAYHTRSKVWLLSAYFPYVITPVVFAIMINFYFLRLNLTGNVAGVFLAQVFITFPYAVLFFYGFWNERIRNMEQLVTTLGGSFKTVLTDAILPSARGMLTVCFFQCFLISWFEYGLTRLIGVGKVQTLTILVYRYISEANPYLAALAGFLLVIPPLMLLITNRKALMQKIWSS